jgi:hypothetical protein
MTMTPKEALDKLRALAKGATMVCESPTRKRAISAQERAEFAEACDVLEAAVKPVESLACGAVAKSVTAAAKKAIKAGVQ